MPPIKPPRWVANFVPTRRADIYPAISPYGALAGSAAGLTVLITGSGRGIGRSAAIIFARAGAKTCVITSRSADELDEVERAIGADAQGKGTKVIKVVADVLKAEDMERLFAEAGKVDVLLNNAGALDKAAPIADSDPDEWWNSWVMNVKGTYLPTRQFLREIARSPRDSPVTIINTSSLGSVNMRPGASSYQATKTAVNRFTEYLHYEYPDTVRAFAYHPGAVLTKLAEAMPEYMHSVLKDSPDLGAGFTLWLATQPKADFLRGRFSSANWDVDELLEREQDVVANNLLFTVVAGQEPGRD